MVSGIPTLLMRHRVIQIYPSVPIVFLREPSEKENILLCYKMALFEVVAGTLITGKGQLCQNTICFVLQEAVWWRINQMLTGHVSHRVPSHNLTVVRYVLPMVLDLANQHLAIAVFSYIPQEQWQMSLKGILISKIAIMEHIIYLRGWLKIMLKLF